MVKISLPYTRTRSKPTPGGSISTFFPSFIGLALRGKDLIVCEATKRISSKFKLTKVEDFLSMEPPDLGKKLKHLKGQHSPVILSWPRENTMVRELDASSPNLRELRETLAPQLDSLFPLEPDEAYFDLYPCGPPEEVESSPQKSKVYLFATPKQEVRHILDRLKVVGLIPSRIIPSPLAFIPLLDRRAGNVVCLYRREAGGYIYNLYRMKTLVKTHTCNEEELKQNLDKDSPETILAIGFEDKKLSSQLLNDHTKGTLVTYLDDTWECTGAALYETCSHPYDFNLLRPYKKRANYQNLYMVSLMALLLSLVFVIPQIAQIKENERLNLIEAEIAGIKEHAFKLKKLERATRARNALIPVLKSREDYIPRIDVLLELSDVLLEDGWIKELSINGNTFELEGSASSLTKVMFLLEDSPIFSNIELIPPLETDKDGKEHFRLKGSISREQTP